MKPHSNERLKSFIAFCIKNEWEKAEEEFEMIESENAFHGLNELYTASHTTALHIVVHRGHEALVSRLIAAGSNVNIKNKNGETPLHVAVSQNLPSVAKLLLAAGADVDATDRHNASPFSSCSWTSLTFPCIVAPLQQELVSALTDAQNVKTELEQLEAKAASDNEAALQIEQELFDLQTTLDDKSGNLILVNDEISIIDQEIENVRNEMRAAELQMSLLQSKKNSLEEKLQEMVASISSNQDTIHQLEAETKIARAKTSELNAEIENVDFRMSVRCELLECIREFIADVEFMEVTMEALVLSCNDKTRVVEHDTLPRLMENGLSELVYDILSTHPNSSTLLLHGLKMFSTIYHHNSVNTDWSRDYPGKIARLLMANMETLILACPPKNDTNTLSAVHAERDTLEELADTLEMVLLQITQYLKNNHKATTKTTTDDDATNREIALELNTFITTAMSKNNLHFKTNDLIRDISALALGKSD